MIKSLLIGAGLLMAAVAERCQWHTGERKECRTREEGEDECLAAGCCWRPSAVEGESWCFREGNGGLDEGHVVKSVQSTETGMRLVLEGTVDTKSTYGDLVSPLQVDIYYETDERFHMKIVDPNHKRFEIPSIVSPKPQLPFVKTENPRYTVEHAKEGELFWVKVVADDGQVLFDSTKVPFEYTNQYLSIGSSIAKTDGIYGLGERVWDFRLPPGTYTMCNLDAYGTPDLHNLYGTQPVYMQLTEKGRAHMVFLRNGNSMDVVVREDQVQYRTIGGIIDLYVMVGGTPSEALQQYSRVVGKPQVPPRWAIGFHQCRYGAPSLDYVKGVEQNYSAVNFPVDTLWVDIDHMEKQQIFTFDEELYPPAEMRKFVLGLQDKHRYMVPILDPAIKYDTNNAVYMSGHGEDNLYIRAHNGTEFVGEVWPGLSVWPDFANPKTNEWWTAHIREYLEEGENAVPFGGLWVDMNEPANFCHGPCDGYILHKLEFERHGYKFMPNNPPYPINNENKTQPLWYKTTTMDARHYDDSLQYDMKNLYGNLMAAATYESLVEIRGTRPFIITRANAPGIGKWAGKWSGDNVSKFDHLYRSISSILNFQLFQVPFGGADICGFVDNTTSELCARWGALGSFYPFSRNHNGKGHLEQEYYRWPEVLEVTLKYYNIRYQQSPMMYTLFQDAHLKGTSIWRPLFFEFPEDKNTHAIDAQFMMGDYLLVTPVVTEGAREVEGYIPKGKWYDMVTYESFESEGEKKTFPAGLDVVPAHIHGGSVMTVFEGNDVTMTDTWAKQPLRLIVAFDDEEKADGEVYFDDGVQIDPLVWHRVKFTANEDGLKGVVKAGPGGVFEDMKNLESIRVLGDDEVKNVKVNGVAAQVTAGKNYFDVTGFSVPLTENLKVTWEH